MRKVMILVPAATGVLVSVAVLVFRVSLDLSWTDSVYFVITTITTVGYGDIDLHAAPAHVKLFGNVLMLSGAASLAAIFGMITDFLLRLRLQEFRGGRRYRMRNHVVLCGLGKLGIRVLKHLRKLGEEVVVVEKSEDSQFLEEVRAMNVPFVVGDIRLSSTLQRAQVSKAASLIAVSDEDLANLEAALTARQVNEKIRTVLRVFDQNLADKVRSGFGVEVAFSTSAPAAPAFAMAAVDPAVIGSYFVGENLMLNVELCVGEGTELAGMTTTELDRRGSIAVLAHTSAATGRQLFHPTDPIPIEPGDTLIVSIGQDFLRSLHEMNAPVQEG